MGANACQPPLQRYGCLNLLSSDFGLSPLYVQMLTTSWLQTADIKEFKDFMRKSGNAKAEAKTTDFEWYVNNGSPFAANGSRSPEISPNMLDRNGGPEMLEWRETQLAPHLLLEGIGLVATEC